jgi:hypothetical protein
MGIITITIIIAAFIIGVIWLMRKLPSISNIMLTVAGAATFVGTLLGLSNCGPAFLEAVLSRADAPAPDVADLLFNVKYETIDGEQSENQKWWTIGRSNWNLVGFVINKSDKELTKLKFEVFIKYGSNVIGDQTVITQRNWKVSPGQERTFRTNSNAFKELPTIKWHAIWGVKLIEVNNAFVMTNIIWSPDNPWNQVAGENAHSAARRVKTIEIIPK